MNEKIDLKNNGYTEEEKESLFEKLKKIGELFGLHLKINEDTRTNNSSADVDNNKINIGLSWTDNGITHKEISENIDDFGKINEFEFLSVPFIIITYLHEVAHLMTMNRRDVRPYWDEYNKVGGCFMTRKDYRNLSYEKLADNLGYQLLNDNYDSIIKILLDKRVRIDKRRINRNQELARQMKAKYITA